MAIKTSIIPVISELNKAGNFDGSASSIAKYAANMLGLDAVQQRAALSAAGLNKAQRELVLTRGQEFSVLQGVTVEELQRKLNLDAEKMAILGNAEANKHLTAEMIKRLVLEGNLSAEQMKIIAGLYAETAATKAQAVANTAAAGSFTTLGTSAEAAFAAMLGTPTGLITLVTTILPLAITLV